MRVTINKSHDGYLQAIASQMGCNAQEALNFMLWKLRESNFNFGGSLPQYPMPNAQYQQPQQQFDPGATAMSALSWQPQSPAVIAEFEQLAQEVDPIIERLAGLIDSF